MPADQLLPPGANDMPADQRGGAGVEHQQCDEGGGRGWSALLGLVPHCPLACLRHRLLLPADPAPPAPRLPLPADPPAAHHPRANARGELSFLPACPRAPEWPSASLHPHLGGSAAGSALAAWKPADLLCCAAGALRAACRSSAALAPWIASSPWTPTPRPTSSMCVPAGARLPACAGCSLPNGRRPLRHGCLTRRMPATCLQRLQGLQVAKSGHLIVRRPTAEPRATAPVAELCTPAPRRAACPCADCRGQGVHEAAVCDQAGQPQHRLQSVSVGWGWRLVMEGSCCAAAGWWCMVSAACQLSCPESVCGLASFPGTGLPPAWEGCLVTLPCPPLGVLCVLPSRTCLPTSPYLARLSPLRLAAARLCTSSPTMTASARRSASAARRWARRPSSWPSTSAAPSQSSSLAR